MCLVFKLYSCRMPPKRSRRVHPAPHVLTPESSRPTPNFGPSVVEEPVPVAPPRSRKRAAPANASEPTPPPRRKRATATITASASEPTPPPRRKRATATVTGPSVVEQAETQVVMREAPVAPSIDAIATAVFDRMRDAGLLPQQPAPAPTPVPAEPVDTNTGLTGSLNDINIDLIEEDTTTNTTAQPSKFITQSLPLGYNVSEKIKQSIWCEQFVELGQLCGPQQPSETIFFQNADASLKICSGPKPSKILNSIHQWTNCFDIFMSIYLSKFSDRALQLIKYANMIRGMSAKLGFEAARYYDEEFRKLRAAHGLEWSLIHDELYRNASSMQARAANKPHKMPFRKDGQQEFKKGFCWRYCRTGKCGDRACKLRHACCFCGQSHATTACRKSKQ